MRYFIYIYINNTAPEALTQLFLGWNAVLKTHIYYIPQAKFAFFFDAAADADNFLNIAQSTTNIN